MAPGSMGTVSDCLDNAPMQYRCSRCRFSRSGFRRGPCRRLPTKTKERLGCKGREKPTGLLRAGDSHSEVATVWLPRRRSGAACHSDPELTLRWVTQLGCDLLDEDYPVEARSFGHALLRWKHEIAVWHTTHVSNGHTDAADNLIKSVKRAAFGSPGSEISDQNVAVSREAKLGLTCQDHTSLKPEAPHFQESSQWQRRSERPFN